MLEAIRCRRADLARRDLAPRGDLEADRLARAAVAAGRGSRPRGRGRARPAELRGRLLRAGARGGARPRLRPRRALPARRALRPRRRACGRGRTSSSTAPTRPERLGAIEALCSALRRRGRARGRARRRRGRRRARRRRGGRGDGPPRRERARPRGAAVRGRARAARLGLPVTLENDINLAALGRAAGAASRAASTTSRSSRSAPGWAPGSCSAASCTAAATARPARSTSCSARLGSDVDPSAPAVAALAERLASGRSTALVPPFDPRDVFAAARRGDPVARSAVAETARRIALHVAPLAAVADVELVVLGGGVGANGDLLLGPVRELLGEWTPYPPRVEVSGLGEAAVLTGALAVGLEGRARQRVREPRRPGLSAPVTRRRGPSRRASRRRRGSRAAPRSRTPARPRAPRPGKPTRLRSHTRAGQAVRSRDPDEKGFP